MEARDGRRVSRDLLQARSSRGTLHGETLDEEITRRGLGDRVRVHGYVDEQAKADLYRRAWLHVTASGSDPESNADAGQLLFLAEIGLLVGAINLALILLEETYVIFIPRG